MNPTVLLIEDNLDMADNISTILQLAHYNVLNAPNGKIGVRLAQENHPDIILCDVLMPELDGYGVLHILNRDPQTASIPFIFLTSKSDKYDQRFGMNLGADDYITKPFEGSDLLKVIEVRLKKNELLKENFKNNIGDVNNFLSKASQFKELAKLSENRPIKTYKRREFLFMEGQAPNDLYFIIHGKVKAFKVNYDGKELITGIHQDGEFMGYVSLLEDKVYNETAEVMEPTQVAVIPKQDFLALIYSNKDVAGKFIKLLSNNLIETENRLLDIAYQSVRQKVAGALLKINEQHDLVDKSGLISIARKDISSMIGTATESLNRTLADFKDEGIIEISIKGIRIINRGKLEKLLHLSSHD